MSALEVAPQGHRYPIINQQEDLRALLSFLPQDIQAQIKPVLYDLEELKIIEDQPLWVLTSGEVYKAFPLKIIFDHMTFIGSKCKTFRDDNRRGIDRTGHRISRVLSAGAPLSYTFRVGRYFDGIGEPFRKFIEVNPSFLLVGEAGTGKTTTLRGLIKVTAEYYPMQVVVVDTSGEVGGSGKIQHPGIGQAHIIPVENKALQALLMEEAVKNQNPRVLAVDEINRLAEAEAIVVGKTNGARLIGTTHGATIPGLLANKNLTPLFDPEPVFHWLVITERRGQYRVYRAAEAVAAVRAGRVPEGEVVYV